MGKSRSFGWIAGAVVVMLAMLALTYFLLYQPKAEAAEASLAEAADVQARNDILAIQNAQLRADFEHLDEYRAELAELAVEIPSERAWGAVVKMLHDFTAAAGLPMPVLEASVMDATPVTLFAVPGAAAPPPADEVSGDSAVDQAQETSADASAAADGHDDAATPAPDAGLTAVDGLHMVPFTVKVVGPYQNVLTYLELLQDHDGRVFFVGDFDIVRQTETDATELRPAIADGDIELTARGYYFALLPAAGMPTQSEDTPATPQPLPPGNGTNPFVPLEPSR